MENSVNKIWTEHTERLMKEVLAKHLGRVPTENDFKECNQLMMAHWPNHDFGFAYQGLTLGVFKTDLDPEKGKFTITFNPMI